MLIHNFIDILSSFELKIICRPQSVGKTEISVLEALLHILATYIPQNIHDVDETVMFYKARP